MESFLARVQQYSGLATRAEADRITRATLRALAAAVSGGQMVDIVAELPADLRSEAATGRDQARSFDKALFLDKVSGGVSTLDPDEVERQVRAVLGTLREWVPDGQRGDTLAQLPSDLARLFEPPPPRPTG